MATVRFGLGRRDITPSFPVMLHGYAERDRLSGIRPEDRVSEPISAGVLALEGTGGRFLVVTVDTIGVHFADVQMLRSAISAATGLDGRDILVAASHTHFAPCISPQLFTVPALGLVEPDPRFVANVTRSVVEAAAESLATMETGTLETIRVPVPGVLFNRRPIRKDSGEKRLVQTSFLYPENPEELDFSPVDPELTALRLVTPAGPRAVLVNFGCHPVTGGNDRERDFYRISADYPFYVRRIVEDAWGCPVFFTLGAAGDAVPMNRTGSCRQQIGAALGNTVLLGERLFAASGRRSAGEVRLSRRTVELTARTTSPELLDAARRAYRARLYPGDQCTIQVQLLRIGETVLVCMPFEVLAEFSLRLKQARPDVVVVSIANGYEGYLPFAYEYERGGYEATADSTHFEPGTADNLLGKVITGLSDLAE